MTAVSTASAISRKPKTVSRTIHDIIFEGNQAISSAELTKRVALKVGKPIADDTMRLSQGLVVSTYKDKGYFKVRVTTDTTPVEPNQVDVRFIIQEGDLYKVGQIAITGNHRIAEYIVRRNFNVHSGEIFSQSKIYEANQQLYMTGYFDNVEFTYSTTSVHTVDMHLKVHERATRYIKGGFGYGVESKERLTLGYEDRNFFGNERKLDLSGTYSGFLTEPAAYETKLAQVTFTQPHLFNSNIEGQANITREYDDRRPYDSVTTAWHSSLGRKFGRKITASLRYRFQGTRLTRVSLGTSTTGFFNISGIGPTFTYDNTNDPFLPLWGWRILGTYEEGTHLFGGGVRFHRMESKVGRFDTGLGGFTIFEGVQSGIVIPASGGDSDQIPVFEHYFIGGANTVRGYSERELGPRDQFGTPIGGNAYLVGNAELRHAIYKKLFGVLFIDGGQLYATPQGDIWPTAEMKSLGDFRYGTGFGFRFQSPVGAVRLEFGYKLNPENAESDFLHRTAIHFSLGEQF